MTVARLAAIAHPAHSEAPGQYVTGERSKLRCTQHACAFERLVCCNYMGYIDPLRSRVQGLGKSCSDQPVRVARGSMFLKHWLLVSLPHFVSLSRQIF